MNRKRIAATVVGLALAAGVGLAILFFTTRVPDADSLPDEAAARLEQSEDGPRDGFSWEKLTR